jgi:penicillin-binding protein 1A
MVGAYATFVNQGIYTKPVLVTRIEDRDGRLIYQNIPLQRRAISDETAFVMMEMLKYAAKGASGFGDLKTELGGKTGTTNEASDGWYMGLTPNLVVGIWTGGEDRWVRFTDKNLGQGARMSRPTFAEYLRLLETTPSVKWDVERKFTKPQTVNIITNCGMYAGESGYDQVKTSSDSLYSRMFEDDFEQLNADTTGSGARNNKKDPFDE